MQTISPPRSLPVTVKELADQLHIDPTENTPQLEALLRAATATVETATNRPILEREIQIDLPEESWSQWWFPCAPVISLIGGEGVTLKRGFSEPRLIREAGFSGEVIRAKVGYASAADAPQQLVEAIQLLAMEWYQAQVSIEAQYQSPLVSFGVTRLIKQVRYRRPREFF